jgi:hypothetical protein
MGAWGAGNFENDDALDLLGELEAGSPAEALEAVFDAVCAAGGQGEEIDATEAARAMASAELIVAARGQGSEDLPADAAPAVEGLGQPPPELVEKAVSAVSYVLMRSELVELWAESDDPGEWNKVAAGLVQRLDAPARAKKISPKKQDGMSAAVCSFCGERIPLGELVSIEMRRPWTEEGISRGIFAHEVCLNAKVHPRHIVQWWTPDIED